jgi:DNA-binding PadR family transcriptional regulator
MLAPLGVAALAMLLERPMHPYEMFQLMEQRRDDRLVKVRPGTLYHAISRLERDGLVEIVGTDRDGRRPERTTYGVTDAGRSQLTDDLVDLLRAPADEYPRFPHALSQAHHLPAEQVERLLAERSAVLRDRDEQLRGSIASVAAREVPERYWIDIGYQRAVLLAEIDWLEAFRARISSGELAW